MKKFLLSIVLFAGLGLSANAQKEGAVNKISIGAEFVYPLELLEASYKIGYGASVQGEYNVWSRLNLTASAGYLSLAFNDVNIAYLEKVGLPTSNATFYPVKAGAKYYYGKFYAAAEIGGTFSADKAGTSLAYAGGLGTSFSIAPKSSLDFGLRYEEWNLNGRYPFVGLRAAYSFGF